MKRIEFDKEIILKTAKQRRDHKKQYGTKRLFNNQYEEDVCGIVGEYCFNKLYGYPFNDELCFGDKGFDFDAKIGKIEIKTTFNPVANLLVKVGDLKKFLPDIIILCLYEKKNNYATFIGWTYGKSVLNSPIKKFKLTESYFYHKNRLRPMFVFDRLFWWAEESLHKEIQ